VGRWTWRRTGVLASCGRRVVATTRRLSVFTSCRKVAKRAFTRLRGVWTCAQRAKPAYSVRIRVFGGFGRGGVEALYRLSGVFATLRLLGGKAFIRLSVFCEVGNSRHTTRAFAKKTIWGRRGPLCVVPVLRERFRHHRALLYYVLKGYANWIRRCCFVGLLVWRSGLPFFWALTSGSRGGADDCWRRHLDADLSFEDQQRVGDNRSAQRPRIGPGRARSSSNNLRTP
jgi:hypothetical protein